MDEQANNARSSPFFQVASWVLLVISMTMFFMAFWVAPIDKLHQLESLDPQVIGDAFGALMLLGMATYLAILSIIAKYF